MSEVDYSINPSELIELNARRPEKWAFAGCSESFLHTNSHFTCYKLRSVEGNIPVSLEGLSTQDIITTNHNTMVDICKRLIELEDAVLFYTGGDSRVLDEIEKIAGRIREGRKIALHKRPL